MTRKRSTIVIVGAGQGGMQAASSLREEGFDGNIRLIGDECCSPYQRPPLSKGFLSGEVDASELVLESTAFFPEAEIDLICGDRVVGLDRNKRQVVLASEKVVEYDHLILATGSRNKTLPCLTTPVDGVVSLRTIADAEALRDRLASARQVVVVGGGFLGLETAVVACGLGASVHVVEAVDRVMERVVSPTISQMFQRKHELNGVRFSFNSFVTNLHQRGGKVCEVELSDGSRLPADLVLVAIGVAPNIELAEAAGLEVGNGIIVNPVLGTRDEAISAIGDCAAFPYAFDRGEYIRLESVQNAVDMARCVAQRLTGGHGRFDQVPVFWSEQAGARLQIAGAAQRDDMAVVRGDPHDDRLTVFRYRQSKLVGVETVNAPADHMTGRRLLMNKLSPMPEQVADVSFDLRQLLAERVGA